MACIAFDLKHVESWRRIMTDLCLTLATLTGSELSNILWLTFGIFALWSILLTHLEMLTWMTVGSESNDRRQWLLSSFSRMGCSYNYHRHSNLRRQQTKPYGVASRANRALPGSGANNPKYSPFSENSKVRANYEYSRLANSSEAQLSKMQLPNKGRGQASAWHFCYWSQWHLQAFSKWCNFEGNLCHSYFCSSNCQGPGFENLKTESPVAQHHPEEAVNKISWNKIPQAQTSQ